MKRATKRTEIPQLLELAGKMLSDALGTSVKLGDPTYLKGSRSLVLRCNNLSGTSPVSFILKEPTGSYDPDNIEKDVVRRCLRGWAGSLFLSSLDETSLPCPRFHAGDWNIGLMALEDCGPKSSVADILFNSDAATATAALCGYGAALGSMHAMSMGQVEAYEQICNSLHPQGATAARAVPWFMSRRPTLPIELENLGVTVEPRFWQEVEAVFDAVENPGPFYAFLHNDPSPANAIWTGEKVKLIDFELSRFGYAPMDVQAARLTFPGELQIPRPVVAEFESAYRTALVVGCPEAQDDNVFETALMRALAYRQILFLHGLPETANSDDAIFQTRLRTAALNRLENFISAATEFNQFPALRGTLSSLLEVLKKRWPEIGPLPCYPAFR